MHDSQRETVDRLMSEHLERDSGRTVYDIGSMDVNGSHRSSVEALGLSYVGVDIRAGKNVDLVVNSYFWSPLPENGCDYIISGSCLEHVLAPWLWVKELERRLRPGGICIVLAPFRHGQHRYPYDCYRFLPDGFRYLFCEWARLQCLECGFTWGEIDTYIAAKKVNPA